MLASEIRPWLQRAARLGYFAKGAVYLATGFLALRAGLGGRGKITDSRGAMREWLDQPFGEVLLAIVGAGLFGYAAWKTIQFGKNPERGGNGGVFQRAYYGVSAVIHAGLGYSAIRLALGDGSAAGGDTTRSWTAWLLAQPLGRWLVGIVAVAVLVAGFAQFRTAVNARFRKKLTSLDGRQRKWVTRLGRLGYSARGVVFALIGLFLLHAAWEADSSEAGGFGEALRTIARQPYGAALLTVTAAGLMAYGALAWVMARYRELRVET